MRALRVLLLGVLVAVAAAPAALAAPTATLLAFNPLSNTQYQYASGSTLWFNSNPTLTGSVEVQVSASDPAAGIDHVTFPAFGTGWTPNTPTDDATPPSPYTMTYAWSSAAAEPGSVTATAYAVGGATAPVTFTVAADAGNPTGGTLNYQNGPTSAASTPVLFSGGTDAKSGVGTRTLQRKSATYTGGVCGSYGAWTTVVTNPTSPWTDTSTIDGNCYAYQLVVLDHVGNKGTFTSTSQSKVDRTAPVGAISASPASPVSGTVSLSGTSSDADSGVQRVDVTYQGPANGTICAAPASPTAWSCSWNTDGLASGTYTINLAVTDLAGNAGTATRTLVVGNGAADTTAPTGTIAAAPAGPVHGSVTLTGTAADDVAVDHVDVTYSGPASGSICAHPATPTSWSCSWSTTAVPDGVYTITEKVYDTAAPTANVATVTRTLAVDNGLPTTTFASFATIASPQSQYAVGSTLFFNPLGTGSVKVTVTAADAGSGVASVAFPSLGVGWTGSGSVTTAPYAATYAWSMGAAEPGAKAATATDAAGNTAPAPFTLTADGAPPVGGSITAPSGVPAGTSSTISFTTPTDAGSGMATVQLQRAVATATSGTCGPYSAWANLGSANPTSPFVDTGVTTSSCYRYQLLATDHVGNSLTVAGDTTPPSGTISTTPASPFSGSVALTGTAADAGSGVARVDVSWTGPASSSGIVCTSPATPATWSCSWNVSGLANGAYVVSLLVHDVAGNTATVTRSVTVDNTATPPTDPPAGGDTTAPGLSIGATPASPFTGAVTVTGTAADAGSGVASVAVTYTGPASGTICPSAAPLAAWSCSWTTSALPDGTYTITATGTDVAGNTGTATRTVVLDNGLPTIGAVAFTAVTGTPFQYASGSTLYVNTAQAGSVAIDVPATDAGTGIAKVEFPALGTGWTPAGGFTAAGPPPYRFTYSWTSGAASPGAKVATARDNAGLTATTPFTITADTAAPAGGSLSGPAGPATGTSATVTFTSPTDGSSGLATTQLQRASAAATSGHCGAFSAYANVGAANPTSPYADTTVLAGTCYRYQLVAADHVGNVRTVVDPAGDTTPPLFPSTGTSWVALSGGAFQHADRSLLWFNPAQAGSARLTVTPTDAGSGIASVLFPALATGWTPGASTVTGAPYAVTYAWAAGAASPGTKRPVATDGAGNATNGSITVLADAAGPTGGELVVPDGATSGAAPAISFTDGVDEGSGLGTTTLLRATAPYVGGACGTFADGYAAVATNPVSPWADTTLTEGTCARYRLVEADLVGNETTLAAAGVVRTDRSAPTGATLTPAAGPTADGAVLVTFATGADAGSGIADWHLERATAANVGGTCGAAGAWTPVGDERTASPFVDTGVPLSTCAWYRIVVRDLAGNALTVAADAPTRIDATLPGHAPDPTVVGPRTTPVPTPVLTPVAPKATTGSDTVSFGIGAHTFDALAGDDTVHGGPDKDTLHGGLGADHLWGDLGADRLFGDAGNDWLFGGPGVDTLDGGAGNDHLDAGDGNDVLLGGAGNDVLDGKAGNDTITAGAGTDVVQGGAGDDVIDVRDGKGGETVRCGAGHDRVRADAGDKVATDCETVSRH